MFIESMSRLVQIRLLKPVIAKFSHSPLLFLEIRQFLLLDVVPVKEYLLILDTWYHRVLLIVEILVGFQVLFIQLLLYLCHISSLIKLVVVFYLRIQHSSIQGLSLLPIISYLQV